MSYDNISKSTINRLIKDIKEVINSDISKDGIYYKHSDTNMLEGYALIIGQPDTPYELGNFLFKFLILLLLRFKFTLISSPP